MINHDSPFDPSPDPERSKAFKRTIQESSAQRALPNTLQPGSRRTSDLSPSANRRVGNESIRQGQTWPPVTQSLGLEPCSAQDKPKDPRSSERVDWIVQIQVREVPGRRGRPATIEKYPFGTLDPIQELPDGRIEGPCFFIPDSDEPEKRLATARKRHKQKGFLARNEGGGMWVWRKH